MLTKEVEVSLYLTRRYLKTARILLNPSLGLPPTPSKRGGATKEGDETLISMLIPTLAHTVPLLRRG